MIKQITLYMLLSIIIVVFARYIQVLVVYLDALYTYLNVKIAPIFSNTNLGVLFRNIITLTILPVAITAIPALAYRAFMGKTMPYYYEATWVMWLVIMLSNVLIR